MVRFYVGVTDGNWYRFLAARRPPEVNFWQPGGKSVFKALSTGEPFLFKTHYRDGNLIVGGGFFSGSELLRLSEAWDFFGEHNGMGSLDELRTAISAYRKEPIRPRYDPVIGCIFLRDVRFFEHPTVRPSPVDFAKNLVTGERYSTEQLGAHHPLAATLQQLFAENLGGPESPGLVEGSVFGEPRLVRPRLGQASFKALVLTAYDRHCAITGDKIRPVLEAAHIRPVHKGGEHRVDNGLLLRSDVHTLFDRGYPGIDLNYRLRVSPAIREEFSNGDEFYARAGCEIDIPRRPADRPGREFLEWHNDVVFQKS